MALIIGLTGGIGSGKSTVAKLFIELGIDVVDADEVARQVVQPGQAALLEIEQYFGADIMDNGTLNRSKLRQVIFQSETKKHWLNALLHPLIREAMLAQIRLAKSAYVILEAPLLFENNLTGYTQYNVVVDVQEKVQIERAMQRDSNSIEQIKAIIDAQITRDERLLKADYIIDNNCADRLSLQQQVKILHAQFISLLK